jgi:cell division protein FtsB
VTVRTQALDHPRVRLTGRAALLIVVVSMLAIFSIVPMRDYLSQRSEIAQLQRRSAELERSNASLRSDIRRLHDPAYLERVARACLGMVRPGEVAFVSKASGTDPAC